jgi:hypothetical protein
MLQQFLATDGLESMKDRDFWAGLATILLKSRFATEWTLDHSRRMPIHLLKQAADFLLAENRQWAPIPLETQLEETPGKKPESTGEESGGNSNSTTPTKKGSRDKVLSAVQSG